MKAEKHGQELRLAAVPLCAGLVFAVTRGMTEVWNGENLTPGFLYGSFIGIVLGIPLLLRSDAKGKDFLGHHLLNALIQALVAWLLAGASLAYLPLAIGRGVALGLLFSVINYSIRKLYQGHDQNPQAQRGWLYAVPLSGALTLGMAASLGFSAGSDERLSLFILPFMVGGFLGMVAGWPVLWCVERYLHTPLRYIAGGMITGLLIWTAIVLPNLVEATRALMSGDGYAWPREFLGGAAFFAGIGMVAGVVCTLINLCVKRIKRMRGSAPLP
ncbi:hypothetical protein [Pseudomonas syringae]|uniref:Uncharacterized protein n=1 Tax=Pseudomonas syringae CC1417 TaxID=1357272 RepID=A0AAU8LEQ2_PSESX